MGHHIPFSSPRYAYISQHSPCKLLCVAILLFTDPFQPTAHKTLATFMPQMTNLLNQSIFSMSPDQPWDLAQCLAHRRHSDNVFR